MAVWGGLTNSCEKKRSEKQRRKERYKKERKRDKKAFLSGQCKEVEERNRMGTEISSRETVIPREHFIQRWAQ